MYLDILSAQTAEEAMELAFFGKDYDEPQSNYPPASRKGHPRVFFEKKYANLNLKFNEVEGYSRLSHLNHYFNALKSKDVE